MTPSLRTIVIVEDSDACAALLEIALCRLNGVELIRYRRAEDGLAQIEKRPECSALLTDLNLPRMDGFELVRRVRAIRPVGTFPILVTSADNHPETPARVIRLGADVYFRKPYSPADVRQTLEKLLDDQHSPNDTV